ncbi:MAG: fructose-bisphosphate aldolase [Candidatus Lokiarchaeota archaeon]|nr:fructose-bisphosphate aldolase [Candidatus Lokiarchaeota archaeon]
MTLEDTKFEHLCMGKRTRLHRMMYDFGPGNGKLLILPIDQGLEHGPIDMFANPESIDPDFQFRLAVEGGFSAIALHIGLAEKYAGKYAGKIPIVLKLNGKTNIPSDDEALSPLTASVEDAVRMGADAVGYTLYVGSPNQVADFTQLRQVRQDATRFGLPLIVWSYPRGRAIELKGGRDSLYAVDYAARVANELGADVVKLNVPATDPSKKADQPSPYDSMELDYGERVRKVVESAGKTMTIFSGGSKIGDEDVLKRAKICMENGARGLIFGRNIWQRDWEDALDMTSKIKKLMKNARQ